MAGMTMKQVQNLLQFLGYYDGIPDDEYGPKTYKATLDFQIDFGGIAQDGKPGEETQKALRHAVAYGMPVYEPEDGAEGDFWSRVRYFTRKEFRCTCSKCGGFPVEPDPQLVMLADDTREHFGAAIDVSSGVRCKDHNAAVGGVVNSRHLTGKAMDFRVRGKTSTQTLAYVNTLPGVRYAYAIDGSYVHMDVE